MLSPTKAMIAISLRYRREDGFYFRLFREAGKLAQNLPPAALETRRHGGTSDPPSAPKPVWKDCLRVSGVDSTVFARDLLIPPEAAAELPTLTGEEAILAFAKRNGIAAGIVVGRMQWDKIIPYSRYNHLRRVMDEGFCALARQGCWQTWPSVKEAAQLAQRDFPHLELRPARAKVSEAAGRGAFVTNGLRGSERRCEPVSLDAWRLRLRDRDLERDEEAA